jgi:hypothetical protein
MNEKWKSENFGFGKSETKLCSICGAPYKGFGHNAAPVNEGRCCDGCNTSVVVPVRIERERRRG